MFGSNIQHFFSKNVYRLTSHVLQFEPVQTGSEVNKHKICGKVRKIQIFKLAQESMMQSISVQAVNWQRRKLTTIFTSFSFFVFRGNSLSSIGNETQSVCLSVTL